jgi:cytochrome P450
VAAVRVLARIAAGRPLEACADLFARYGDTVYVPVRPWKGLYILSRPEQAEHVLAANQDNYVKPFTYRPLRLLLGDGLVTAEVPTWRRHRRIVQPAFSSRNIASLAAEMDDGARRATGRWGDKQVIDVAGEMTALAADVAGRALFGIEAAAGAPPRGPASSAGEWLALLAGATPVTSGPRSSLVVRAAAARLGIGGVWRQAERVAPGGRAGLLELLRQAQDAGALSAREVSDEVGTFLGAGSETTAMALTWSLALLSAYPHARQRLEDETDALPGDGPADLEKLPWTTAVISEAMRLYPPAWTLERTAIDDDNVGGTPVPAGSMVAVLPYLVHRNPAVWPNPSGFDPERFLPGGPPRHRYSWIPFGGGKRGCVGAGFARQEAVLALARICRDYRLDLLDAALPAPRGLVTLRPAGPVRMRLTRRC